jgi:uncharacterized membrane protein YfcA
MIAHLTVALAAMFAAGLTMYSGFGLGTLLLPVFALFYPVEVAVMATAIVHGANNVFKVSLLGRHADIGVALRFGIPAVLFAAAGAYLLGILAGSGSLMSWSLGDIGGTTTPLKLLMGGLILLFALFELLPGLKRLQFDRRYLPLGGVLSGFFGGLSGHQGALRAAFLVKTGLSTQVFVGTNAVIGLSVDLVRIMSYLVLIAWVGGKIEVSGGIVPLLATGILAAFSGVLIGKRYLYKVRMQWVQSLTGTLLLLIAITLGAGLI